MPVAIAAAVTGQFGMAAFLTGSKAAPGRRQVALAVVNVTTIGLVT
jgi:hypothetical protein